MLVNQPVLCLRGGGADKKRKEARKRKFANLQSDDENTPLANRSRREPDVQTEPVAKKQRTQASSTPEDIEAWSASEADPGGKEEVEDVNVENGDSQQNRQRFIVFIGMILHVLLCLYVANYDH